MLRTWKKGIAIAAFILPVIVVAQPPPPGGFGPGRGPGPRGGPGQHEFGPPMHPGPGPMGGPGFGGDIWERPEVRQRLGLLEEQVQQLQQSRLELETKRIETHAELEIARLNLESQLKKKAIDKAAVDALVDELGELHKENIRRLVQQKIALSEILDASQLEKVDAFLDRARARDERRPFLENFQGGRREDVGRMREEMQKRRQERMDKAPGKDDRGPKKGIEKKDRKGAPDDKVGFGPRPGAGASFGPPPGAGLGGPHGAGRPGPQGRRGFGGGPRGPGFGGPQGPGFGPPSPSFPPSD